MYAPRPSGILCVSLTSYLVLVSWGESAGAISVALHMVTNSGNPDGLFRAAFMQSGSPPSTGDITLVRE
jgi:Carboxylesterase family